MKRKSSIKFCFIICCMCVVVTFFTGCGKKFWDYDCVWVSESPYIYMPLEHENIIIEVEEGKRLTVNASWENTGEKIYFYENGKNGDIQIWEADVKLKKGKLYLKIIEDYYGDYKGQEFVLEQRPVKKEQKIRYNTEKKTKDILRNTIENSAQDIPSKKEDNTEKSTPDVSESQDDPFTFDITDYYTEGQEQNTSLDAYRTIYVQIIKKLPEDIDFSLICLDDDEIPELAVNGAEREIYSIYTVREGKLSCLVDSIRTRALEYYERSGIISEFGTSRGGGDTGGYGLSFHQVSENQIITDDSRPILTWSYSAIYDDNDNFMGEGEVTCSYMGQEIDEETYEEICRNLGFNDNQGKSLCIGRGIEKEAAIQLLSRSDTADSESSGNLQESYRELYKKKFMELSNDMTFSFIYLDDDDVPELTVCKDESVYSIYTVKNGALFCIADSIETEDLGYIERQGIICASVGWKEGSAERRDSYYQTSSEEILTNDSQPILERSNDILYDKDSNRIDEETPNRYRYMGINTSQEIYDKMCKELGITEYREMKWMCTGNSLDKEIALELLNP